MNWRNQVITEENVQELAEWISIVAVKAKAVHSNGQLDHLYKGLLYDVYRKNDPDRTYSDGYDVVQMIVCFLWENKGRNLSDHYGKNKKGKDCTILYACYNEIDRYLSRYRTTLYTTVSIEDNREKVEAIEYIPTENDYTEYDKIVDNMSLSKGEQETLDCYMAGMTYLQIARFLDVHASTIWRRRINLQKKYRQIME